MNSQVKRDTGEAWEGPTHGNCHVELECTIPSVWMCSPT